MKTSPGTDWATVAAWASWAMVAIYVILGFFAWRQVREGRRLREEQARPFVIVDFEPGFLIYLTIENIGKTMARNVRITFDKQLQSARNALKLEELSIFRKPIPSIPPGKKIRVWFDEFTARSAASLPLAYTVTIAYQGVIGRESFEESYVLDLEPYVGSQMPQKGIAELVMSVEGLREEAKKWRADEVKGITVHNLDLRKERRSLNLVRYIYILRKDGLKSLIVSLWKEALVRLGLLSSWTSE